MKYSSIVVIAVLLAGLSLVSTARKADALPVCCQITSESCFDSVNPLPIECPDEDIIIGALCNFDTGQCVSEPRNIPTLSEWGLIATAGILGMAGFIMLRRRKQVTV